MLKLQVIPNAIIPSLNLVNVLARGIRVTQRSVRLISEIPSPLLGSYDKVSWCVYNYKQVAA